MSVKYVKDFKFPAEHGWLGSAGKTSVKGYLRGGGVKPVAKVTIPAPPRPKNLLKQK